MYAEKYVNSSKFFFSFFCEFWRHLVFRSVWMAKDNLKIRGKCITNNNNKKCYYHWNQTCCLQNKQLLRAYKQVTEKGKQALALHERAQLSAVPRVQPYLASIVLKGAGKSFTPSLTSSAWMEWPHTSNQSTQEAEASIWIPSLSGLIIDYLSQNKQSSSSFTKSTLSRSKKRSREEARCQSLNRQVFLQQHTEESEAPGLLHTVVTEYNQGSSSNSQRAIIHHYHSRVHSPWTGGWKMGSLTAHKEGRLTERTEGVI